MRGILALLLVSVLLISGCVDSNALKTISSLASGQRTSSGSQDATALEDSEISSGSEIVSGGTSSGESPQTIDCKLLESMDSDAYKCSSNEDCIIFIDTCCSIMSKAVNKNYESCLPEGKVDILGKPCGEYCAGTGIPKMVLCMNNMCALSFDNITSAYTPTTVTCATDADCELSLCNCQCQQNGTDKGMCASILPADNCIANVGISGCKCADGECVTIS